MKMTWSETQRAVGKAQGVRHMLLHQLAYQFGPLPERVRQQIEAISSLDRLIELAERLLTARSLEEMGLA
jgi:hypothetical protein